MGMYGTWGHVAWGDLGQQTWVKHQGMWHSGIYGDTGWHRDSRGTRTSVGWCRVAQGSAGWQGLCGDGHCPSQQEPTVSPRQVKRSLQGTAAYEIPIAFEELEGTCRTSYGYPKGAGTARAPPAALALALVLALLLSVLC